ncbi:Phosphopantothenate--cysteine ligase cab2 [Dispira simplex]|nr:Phosphopantothenate--cysteine ligase cab2 [Dispira simplex]
MNHSIPTPHPETLPSAPCKQGGSRTPTGCQSVLESHPFEQIDPDTYFTMNPTPPNLPDNEALIEEFVQYHQALTNCPVVLITSGGTIVPLENQTVRFIDNFSAGTRGAASAEYFIKQGYAVIFMHRERSLQPFARHFGPVTLTTQPTRGTLLDYLMVDPDTHEVKIKPDYQANMRQAVSKYQAALQERRLLMITFTTLSDYLFLLRSATRCLSRLGPRVMCYLAAAVSDFFIPAQKMVEHKIQSAEGGLTLTMDQVPKFLRPLVYEWAPRSFIVSFKLETDPDLLIPKAKHALTRYGHQVVIGNLLTSRKRTVTFITPERDFVIHLSEEECLQNPGLEIEAKIVTQLMELHRSFIEATEK